MAATIQNLTRENHTLARENQDLTRENQIITRENLQLVWLQLSVSATGFRMS